MSNIIGYGAKVAVLTPDSRLFQATEKALRGYTVAHDIDGARVIIADIGARTMALPPNLPSNVPVIALVPRRTFDMARALYNAGANDVLVRNVPPGTLKDAVQALMSLPPQGQPAQRALSHELLFLRQLSDWARAGGELRTLFQRIVDSVADVLDVDIVSLMLIESNPEKQKEFLRIQAARGLSEQIMRLAQVELGQGISGLVASKGEPLLVQDVEKANLGIAANRDRYVTKSLLSVPIRARTDTIGVLNVNNKISGNPFDDNDMNLLVTLCNQAGLAIDNARLVTGLRDRASDLEKLNQQLSKLSDAKSELICNLSHELKTPLTSIQGYIDLMRSGIGDPGKSDEYLDKVADRSSHLVRLTDRIITFFTLDAKLTEFQHETFPLGVLVWTCVDSVRSFADANEIKLEMDLEKIDRHVFADRQFYRELLQALFDNAVKFNRRGGRVRVYGDEIDQNGRKLLEVFVEDTGRGIAKSLHEQIFEDFKQTDNVLTAKPDGLGLGLSIARSIAEGHDCCLRLVKTGGTGSIFAFTVPLATETP